MREPLSPNAQELSLTAEADTLALGQALASALVAGGLVILEGNLGAGKTFLAGAIVHAMGLDPDEPVTSPTYNLVSEYHARLPIFHADLYRLRSEDELFELGLDELRDQGGVLLVEWGLVYLRALGGDALVVEMGGDPRRARLYSTGPESELVLDHTRKALSTSGLLSARLPPEAAR